MTMILKTMLLMLAVLAAKPDAQIKVTEPHIPSRKISIDDFGGNGDGKTMNTEAFAKAVEYLSQKGGGHLNVPEGTYLTGPIELKSNIDLHLANGAEILFSEDKNLYPVIWTSFEGLDTWRLESPIHADGASNVSITGRGIIDGNGGHWRLIKKSKVSEEFWNSLQGGVKDEKKGVWYPSETFREAQLKADMNTLPKGTTLEEAERLRDFLRPVMVSLRNCKNVLLEGCTFQNSPCWNLHPLLCENVTIRNVSVKNPSYAQNGDGIDIESCKNVVLKNSTFDVGDDAICVKSGKDEDGRMRGVPTENLTIEGCSVLHGHGGFVVGSEMSGGVKNVKVTDCRFIGTDVGLRFKSKRGRGGVVEGIWIENIEMSDIVTDAILFDLFYDGKSAVESQADGKKQDVGAGIKADETTPEFRDIHIKGIKCEGAARAMYFNGLPEKPIEGITIKDCDIKAGKDIEMKNVSDVKMENVNVKTLTPKFTIHLMGDSTMAPKDLSGGNPERGWGMMFPNFLDKEVAVINYAQNGRSTKSFIDRGLFEQVKANLKAGDYVFIQFGHNDSKESDSTRYAAPWGAYQENLRHFIKTVNEAGAHPVLLTPVSRRWFKNGELDFNCHGDYPAAMKKVAEETATPLLDMTTATQNWLKEIGDEASKPYYMTIYKDDNTHTNARGARKLTTLTCEEIRKSGLEEIKTHLLESPAEIVVAQDGTGDYMTVQEAINACPDYDHGHITTIHIKEGVYKEMVTIPHNKFRLKIIGEGTDKTIISFDKYARKLWPDTDREMGTSGSATMYIHSSYVTLEDLAVENTAGEGKEISQAVALFTDGDFLFFHRCRFIGNQDTVYTYGRYGKDGGIKRNYFLDCYIEGTTDFIFGPSIAYFENCQIHSKKNSYVTAASTFEDQKYGYIFNNCVLTADFEVTKCYLGRPWGAYAKTLFMNCELGSHILPEGWHNWEKEGKPNTEKNSWYAEYNNYGPGAATEGRVKWSKQLKASEAEKYSFEKVMYQSNDGIIWNPFKNK